MVLSDLRLPLKLLLHVSTQLNVSAFPCCLGLAVLVKMDFRIGPRLFLHSKKSMAWMSVSLACMFRNMVPTVLHQTRVASIFPTWTAFISFIRQMFERPCTTKFSLGTWNIRKDRGKSFDLFNNLARLSFYCKWFSLQP